MCGKMQRSKFKLSRTRATQIGQLIHSNVCGPMHVATPRGSKYFVLFTDDFSGYCTVKFLKQKSEVANSFEEYVNILRRDTGQPVHTLRADNGGEFTGHQFIEWLSTNGIRLESSAPHTPEQNGVLKRANRTFMEGVRCLIHARSIPPKLWGEACAVYRLNRVSTKTAPPYQNWFGSKPDVSNLRIFGSTAYIHVPEAERRKLDSKSITCFFVGYCTTQKAYVFGTR
jgi:transposase InsO family protein